MRRILNRASRLGLIAAIVTLSLITRRQSPWHLAMAVRSSGRTAGSTRRSMAATCSRLRRAGSFGQPEGLRTSVGDMARRSCDRRLRR